jgi:hypothetical protein
MGDYCMNMFCMLLLAVNSRSCCGAGSISWRWKQHYQSLTCSLGFLLIPILLISLISLFMVHYFWYIVHNLPLLIYYLLCIVANLIFVIADFLIIMLQLPHCGILIVNVPNLNIPDFGIHDCIQCSWLGVHEFTGESLEKVKKHVGN